MKTFLLIIGTLSFSNITFSQTENSYNSIFSDTVITNEKVGIIKLGDKLEYWVEKYKDNIVEYEDKYYVLDKNENVILEFWSKNDTLIYGIQVTSKKYSTKNGIRVGTRIDKLLELYPDMAIDYLDETGEECLIVPDMTISGNIIVCAFLKSDTDEQLGKYAGDNWDKTTDFSTNGYVFGIEIFIWGK